MGKNMSSPAVFGSVRQHLRDVLEARSRGESERRLRSAHAFVDGYMQAMLDAGLATRAQLLSLVKEERELLCGPATAEVADDGFDADEGALPVQAPTDDESGVRPRRGGSVAQRASTISTSPLMVRAV